MKKYISLSAIVLMLSLAFSSCKKQGHGKTTYQVIEVNLDANKTYQYSFPTSEHNLAITGQSKNFVVSELDKVDNALLFNYTPKANFVGTDEVEISTAKGEQHHDGGQCNSQGNNHPQGNCQHHGGGNCGDHNQTVYTFKFTIHNVATTSTTKAVEAQK